MRPLLAASAAALAALALAAFASVGSRIDLDRSASTVLDVRVAEGDAHVPFGSFRIVLPRGWRWRFLPGLDGQAIQVSNASFQLPPGRDPIKELAARTFVLTLLPLGSSGSPTAAAIGRSDFLAKSDAARPRGHALARHSYCSASGPCLSIALEYGSERVPDALLAIP